MNRLKRQTKSVDLGLLLAFIILVGFGLIMVTSAAYPLGLKYYNDGFHYGKRQLVFSFLGIITAFIASRLPRDFIKKYSPHFFLFTLILVLALWSPLKDSQGGQARWLKIPYTGFKFQPSDLLKVSSILFLARVLDVNKNRMEKRETFITIIVIIALAVIPIMIKDLSTGAVIAFTLLVMYIVGGIRPHQFVSLVGIGVAVMIPMVVMFWYRVKRIFGYLNPDLAVLDENYHITQSLYAIAMGGLGGVGFFHSRQKYSNLPAAHNDFIFSIICEELGLLGAVFLIIMYFILIYRGLVVAYKSQNYYDKYVAVGITSYIGIQTVFNLGVGCGLFPVTGITLPLISYGGTSLLVTMASIGLLLGVSRRV
ncbi:FtsW/RodA/SpoVE family cell cycle protein [Peptoniphilus catoniae]|uniref:FtsW/RodA/SpoVE family cell cycle protein n=1 Tax=Peptoniphilus catoniae TaxID=1660341 RepID=UPI0010FE174E|nr:putative peptidoglycan glycosyltransferase FtsW [Peptoniphilus catoniae]